MHFRVASCFLRAEALTRLVLVTLQVSLHFRMNAWTERTPTSASWLGNRGGWYPKQHSKGDILEEEEVWLLTTYSAYSNWKFEETGLWELRHCKTVSRHWFARSVLPLDCG